VVCPDNTQCFNGGVCIVSSENTTSYTCFCPEQGDPEKRCEDLGESRTYARGPVREVPVSEGGIFGIIVASMVAVVAVALLVSMTRRRRHTRVMTEAFEEVDIDELRERVKSRVGGYRDNVDEEDDSGISITEII
jgi:HAMP domain-containing protein